MFTSDSSSLIRILVVGTLSYILILLVLRISGKRTLSKMNSFDFIVTVALGSVLGSILTSQDIALVDGILAFGLLVLLQFITSWLSVRSDFFSQLIKSSPKLLYYDGQFNRFSMKKERVPEKEILQAVRSNGYASLDEVRAVILETDGTFSVISNSSNEKPTISSLKNVKKGKDDN
ncbi:DUF421 domain-containing protein [Desemzia sp. FAM 23991]|uniref:DUF421 domain-containing protein n=1 Tax=unclassified Desemzia TaxID=2685243 RepID=UPI00388397E0